MKFVKTEGCTDYGWTVDGKDLNEVSPEMKEQIFIYLCLRLREAISENNKSLTDLIEIFDYVDFDYDPAACGQCGDSVSTTTWEI